MQACGVCLPEADPAYAELVTYACCDPVPCSCETQLPYQTCLIAVCLLLLIAGGTWTSRRLPCNKQQHQDWCALPTSVVSQPAGLVFHIKGTAGPCCLLRTSSANCDCKIVCLADCNSSNTYGSSANSSYSSSTLNTIANVLQLLAGGSHNSGNCRLRGRPAGTDDAQHQTAKAAALLGSSARMCTISCCPPAPARPKPPVTLVPVIEFMPCAYSGCSHVYCQI